MLALFAAVALLVSGGCKSPSDKGPEAPAGSDGTTQPQAKPEAKPQAPPGTDPKPNQGDAAGKPAETIPLKDEVRDLIRERGKKQQCNDLTGCGMVSTLVALGPKAVPAIRDAYATSKGDGHWRFRLLEVLGRIRHKSAGPFLVTVLQEDRYPHARVEAAIALARIGDRAHLAAVQEAVKGMGANETFEPAVLAAAYALAALGDASGRELIAKRLVIPEGEYRRWDKLRPGVYAAGQLRMKALRPRLEVILKRADPFVRREAARALGAMRDREAIVPLVEALNDRVPGVRSVALESLRTLTGFRHKESYAQWKRWLDAEGKKP